MIDPEGIVDGAAQVQKTVVNPPVELRISLVEKRRVHPSKLPPAAADSQSETPAWPPAVKRS